MPDCVGAGGVAVDNGGVVTGVVLVEETMIGVEDVEDGVAEVLVVLEIATELLLLVLVPVVELETDVLAGLAATELAEEAVGLLEVVEVVKPLADVEGGSTEVLVELKVATELIEVDVLVGSAARELVEETPGLLGVAKVAEVLPNVEDGIIDVLVELEVATELSMLLLVRLMEPETNVLVGSITRELDEEATEVLDDVETAELLPRVVTEDGIPLLELVAGASTEVAELLPRVVPEDAMPLLELVAGASTEVAELVDMSALDDTAVVTLRTLVVGAVVVVIELAKGVAVDGTCAPSLGLLLNDFDSVVEAAAAPELDRQYP
ncbi:hypothetical protein LTR50_004101 [Elasticomyces elasticus]|nr:hypothetical protein LTR50_004101 [Elasticomyces elasticus]